MQLKIITIVCLFCPFPQRLTTHLLFLTFRPPDPPFTAQALFTSTHSLGPSHIPPFISIRHHHLIHRLLNLSTIRHLRITILLCRSFLLRLSTGISFLLCFAGGLLLCALLCCRFFLDAEDGLALFFDFVVVSLWKLLAECSVFSVKNVIRVLPERQDQQPF